MGAIGGHLTKCFIAGFVALLPVSGLILMVGYVEFTIADTGLKELGFYFPGFGILASLLIIYFFGLIVSTFLGKWVFGLIDKLLSRLPALGALYNTLKQVLGYGEGKDAIFHEVVLVPGKDAVGEEIGFVTNSEKDSSDKEILTVFVPGAPNPSNGRLLVMERSLTRKLDMPVHEAMQALVSVGKNPIPVNKMAGQS